MESSRGYLGKVTCLGAVCDSSCFIESFLAVECAWDQIIWELLALCSCQSLAVTPRPGAALGPWGEQDAREAVPCHNKAIWECLPSLASASHLAQCAGAVKRFPVEQLGLSCCLSGV